MLNIMLNTNIGIISGRKKQAFLLTSSPFFIGLICFLFLFLVLLIGITTFFSLYRWIYHIGEKPLNLNLPRAVCCHCKTPRTYHCQGSQQVSIKVNQFFLHFSESPSKDIILVDSDPCSEYSSANNGRNVLKLVTIRFHNTYFPFLDDSSTDNESAKESQSFLLPDFTLMPTEINKYDIFNYDHRTIKEIWVDCAKSHYRSQKSLQADRYTFCGLT